MDPSEFQSGPGLPGGGGPLDEGRPPGGGESDTVRKGGMALVGFLRRIRRRVLADRFLRNASTDLAVSVAFLAGFVLVDRVLLPGTLTPAMALGIILVSVAVSLVRTAVLAPLDLFQAALLADSRLKLKERVSSAVFIAETQSPDPAGSGWHHLIALDAERSLAGVRLEESFPLRAPRRALAWLGAGCLACAALVLWFPAFDVLGIATRKEAAAKTKESVKEEEKKLGEEIAELVKKADDPELRKLLEALAKRAVEPQKPETPGEKQKTEPGSGDPKKEALVNLSRREDEIRQARTGEKLQPLEEAKKILEKLPLKDADLTKKLREALKEGKFEEAKKELGALKDEIANLGGKKPEDMTAAEKEKLTKLASELARLASDSKALSKLSQSLSNASSGLSSKDFPGSLESLELSREELESLARLAQDADVLDQALELVQLTKEDLQRLQSCPECGTPYCQDCGKPQCSCKPQNKPGGT